MIAELLRLLEKLGRFLYDLFTPLWGYLQQFLTQLSRFSLLELLQSLLMLVIALAIIYGLIKLSAFVVGKTFNFFKKLFQMLLIITVILLLFFWLTSPLRPCMFEAEAKISNCNLARLNQEHSHSMNPKGIWHKIKQWLHQETAP
jgi:hypothetical protein